MPQVVTGLWGGRKHGSFASKASGRPSHAQNQVVTGLWGGREHGSFAGKSTGVVTRPAHAENEVVSGLWGGRRFGSFANKTLYIDELIGRKYPRRGKYGRKPYEKIDLVNLNDKLLEKKILLDVEEKAKNEARLQDVAVSVANSKELQAIKKLSNIDGLIVKFDEFEQIMDEKQLVLLLALAMEE